MKLHDKFIGGNIRILRQENDVYFLDSDLRDTEGDWFYWAFCIEGAGGRTVTFRFPPARLGCFGPAVSLDLDSWHWLGAGERDSFTYTFADGENAVCFAHSMLYHPARFYRFAERAGLTVSELCRSNKGRRVPYVRFGDGRRKILLTARHHACESTGSYVLEGVLDGLLKNPLPDTEVIAVPFVDFDGVTDGDQGKNRRPYDHNRDYTPDKASIYPEVRAIRQLAAGGVEYAFDFHSPWHCGQENDTVFVVRKRVEKQREYDRFAAAFESCINENALFYARDNDYPPDTGWNSSGTTCFGCYMFDVAGARLAFSLETAYFGTEGNRFTQARGVETGRCFAAALQKFDRGGIKISFTGDILCSREMLQNTGGDFRPMFAQIADTLRGADYLVGNLETPVAGRELGYTDAMYCFNTPESLLAAMKESGFSLLTLANNHILDRGEEGVVRTLAHCRAYGFDTIGAYDSQTARDAVFVKEIGGIRVAFINYTYGVNAFAHRIFPAHGYTVNLYQPAETLPGSIHLLRSAEEIARDTEALYGAPNATYDRYIAPYLAQLKSDIERAGQAADVVLVVSHSGGQYNETVDAYTKYVNGFVRSCGADAVIGHHPHVIQPCECDNGVPIAYSLGNFVCDFLNNTSVEKANSVIDPAYSVLLNLYLTKRGKTVEIRAGYRILKTIMENSVSVTAEAYALYRKTRDAALRRDILFYANRFAGTDTIRQLRREYALFGGAPVSRTPAGKADV